MPRQATDPFWHNHEGSVTYLTDGTGAFIELYRYDAFGAPSIWGPPPNWTPLSATAYGNRFMFTGREYSSFGGQREGGVSLGLH